MTTTGKRPGESAISVDREGLLPANSHITAEEFFDVAEAVDSLLELSRETRLPHEKCRRLLQYFERRDEVESGFGFIRARRDEEMLPQAREVTRESARRTACRGADSSPSQRRPSVRRGNDQRGL